MHAFEPQPWVGGVCGVGPMGVEADAVVAGREDGVGGGGPGADRQLGGLGVFQGVGPHLGQQGL